LKALGLIKSQEIISNHPILPSFDDFTNPMLILFIMGNEGLLEYAIV
jgi:hypothetical protein